MIPDAFDSYNEIFYIHDNISYATALNPAPYTRKLEDWAHWHGAKTSPDRKILPVFPHFPGTTCSRDLESKSRLNIEMFLSSIGGFCSSFMSVSDSKRVDSTETVALIVPYKSMERYAASFL
jgi:hypothetical protein